MSSLIDHSALLGLMLMLDTRDFLKKDEMQCCIPPIGRNWSTRLDKYYQSAHCLICRTQSSLDVCESCSSDTMKERLALMEAFKKQEKKLLSLKEVCRSCTGCVGEIEWISLDCPIYLEKLKVKKGIEVKFGKILKNNKRN